MSSPSRVAGLALAFGIAVGGCSNAEVIGQVTGTVRFKGQPVSEGMIVFSNPEKGITIQANLEKDGSYEVNTAKGFGLPVGMYEVSVVPPLPQVTTAWPMKAPKPTPRPDIPERYRNGRTSSLKAEVVAAGIVFDVDMTPD